MLCNWDILSGHLSSIETLRRHRSKLGERDQIEKWCQRNFDVQLSLTHLTAHVSYVPPPYEDCPLNQYKSMEVYS